MLSTLLLTGEASGTKFNIFSELLATNSNLGVGTILLRLVVSLIFALFVYFVYRFTFSGVTFNRNFGGTIVITTLVTSVIMMIINSNLALSLGMVGALSIIRFRNAVKDSRDIAFIFWSVAVGLATGVGLYPIAFFGTLIIGIFVVVFNLLGFAKKTYLLVVRAKPDVDSALLTKAVNHYSKKFRVRMKNSGADSVETIYEMDLARGADDVMVEKIASIPGVLSVNMVSGNEEI